MAKIEEFHWHLLGLCSSWDSGWTFSWRIKATLTLLHHNVFIYNALTQMAMEPCMPWLLPWTSRTNLRLYLSTFTRLQILALGWIVESIKHISAHLRHTTFYCISTSSQNNVVPEFTYLEVVLPCSYCLQIFKVERCFSYAAPGSAVLCTPPISAIPSHHYVVKFCQPPFPSLITCSKNLAG